MAIVWTNAIETAIRHMSSPSLMLRGGGRGEG